MRIYQEENVWEAGLQRIEYLFDEFENVIVGYSGGKDSCVTLELALIVARKKNRLPLKVCFIDQEAEWKGTIDNVREVMYREEVDPMWMQMPISISNNASVTAEFHDCWDEKDKHLWIHEQDDISIKENTFGTKRFHELFGPILRQTFPEGNAIYLGGVRAEESPKRVLTLTKGNVYKGITWGKVFNKEQRYFTFYPLYDWSYTDIWKAILDNKWKYNVVYDEMYKHGVAVRNMRISNVHHETALESLLIIQEIEPETWQKLTNKLEGINTVKHLKSSSYTCPKVLPKAFETWKEYAVYLADNIIDKQENKDTIVKLLKRGDKLFIHDRIMNSFHRNMINTILSNDWDLTKDRNWYM